LTLFNAARRNRVPTNAERKRPQSIVSGARRCRADDLEVRMFGWAITFLVIALIAALLGFGGIADFAVDLARIVFFVAIVLLVISLVFGFIRGRSPTVP
jgi:uncharacterized membrane protein YtjA (UPF0391 family)